jgi:hypothetical protein
MTAMAENRTFMAMWLKGRSGAGRELPVDPLSQNAMAAGVPNRAPTGTFSRMHRMADLSVVVVFARS